MALEEDEADAHDGADDRGHQDDGGQGLPAEPRAQGGQQLEVAVAHAFLAGDQLEEPVDAPQRQVAGHGADDGIGQRGHAVRGKVEQQPAPQQRQCQAVGQQLGVVVDEGEGHQHAAEDGGGDAGDAEAQVPDAGGGQHAGQQLHQRVAHGNGLAAFAAGTAQEEPRQYRDVFQGGDLVAAVRAARARYQQVEGGLLLDRGGSFCGSGVLLCQRFFQLGFPLGLHHQRQPVDDHVEEAAHQQAHHAGDDHGEFRRDPVDVFDAHACFPGSWRGPGRPLRSIPAVMCCREGVSAGESVRTPLKCERATMRAWPPRFPGKGGACCRPRLPEVADGSITPPDPA